MQRQPYANKRELSPILDQDAQSHFDPNMLSTFSPLDSQPSAAITSPMDGPLSVPGPLPNPGFSFGNNDPNAMPPPEFNDPSLPLMTPIMDQQGLSSGNMMYRENRIGSMASMFSQGTMESADTVGDWDVQYNYGAGLEQDAAQILRPEDSLALPIDFDSSTRRASAWVQIVKNGFSKHAWSHPLALFALQAGWYAPESEPWRGSKEAFSAQPIAQVGLPDQRVRWTKAWDRCTIWIQKAGAFGCEWGGDKLRDDVFLNWLDEKTRSISTSIRLESMQSVALDTPQ
jgi:hypothetical protein